MTEEEAAAAPEGTKTLPLDRYAAVQVRHRLYLHLTVPDVVPVQTSARARRARKLLRWISLDKHLDEQKSL